MLLEPSASVCYRTGEAPLVRAYVIELTPPITHRLV